MTPAGISAVPWHDMQDEVGLSTGPLSRPWKPTCGIWTAGVSQGGVGVPLPEIPGSFPHIAPTGATLVQPEPAGPPGPPPYTKVPNTQPVVAATRSPFTAIAICSSRPGAAL